MPRLRIRLAGIAFVLACTGCSAGLQQLAPAVPAAPVTPPPAPVQPTPVGVAWSQQLAFSGDFGGTLSQIVPADSGTRSQCTGRNSKTSGRWDSYLFGPVGNQVYGVLVRVAAYRGPGTYPAPLAGVQVHKTDNSSVWTTLGEDPASFVVDGSEESGTLDATLSNLSNPKTKLKVTGRWSCRS